jgi:hypothetical protein
MDAYLTDIWHVQDVLQHERETNAAIAAAIQRTQQIVPTQPIGPTRRIISPDQLLLPYSASPSAPLTPTPLNPFVLSALYAKDRRGRRVGGRSSSMPSSWIDGIGWDRGELTMLAYGRQYTWSAVPEEIFHIWATGLGVCQTDDPTGKHRWWIGKTPSWGACWHYQIRPWLAEHGYGGLP